MRASQASRVLYAIGVAFTFGMIAAPTVRAQESFANEDIGYRLRLPDGYKKSAGSFSTFGFAFGGDKYQLDSFESSKKISLPNGWSIELAMYTLWFPARSAAEIKRAELEAEKSASEKKDGESAVVIMGGGRIYQSFEEYAKNRWSGFYFGEEKKQTIAGFPAVLRPMIFEKLQEVPHEWLSCTLAVPGGEFAMVCSAPQSHVDKLRSSFMNAFKSFKVMRTEGLKIPPLNDTNIDIKEGAKIDKETMSPDEIKKALADDREKAFAKALAKVDKNWKSFRTDNYLVIYETDPKYAQLAGRQAEDLRKWLATNFEGIGDGFEQSAILKIYRYDSSNTDAGFELFGFGSGPIVEEINFRQPESKGMDAEFSSLNTSIMSNWFRQKNQELWSRMPRWLGQGLTDFVDDAEKAGGKLRFEPDEWEKDAMIEAFNAQKQWEKEKAGDPPLKDVEDLMKMTGKEMWEGGGARFARTQCSSVVRYLVEGPGSRGKSGAILRNYIKHLYDLVQEVEKKLDAERKERMKGAVAKDGLSDEEKLAAEDEEYKKKRKDALDNVEKTLLEKTFAQTFEGWDEADWRSFQHSWKQYAEGRTK